MEVVDVVYKVIDVLDGNNLVVNVCETSESAERFVIKKQLDHILQKVDANTLNFIQFLMEFVEDCDLKDYFVDDYAYKIVACERKAIWEK